MQHAASVSSEKNFQISPLQLFPIFICSFLTPLLLSVQFFSQMLSSGHLQLTISVLLLFFLLLFVHLSYLLCTDNYCIEILFQIFSNGRDSLIVSYQYFCVIEEPGMSHCYSSSEEFQYQTEIENFYSSSESRRITSLKFLQNHKVVEILLGPKTHQITGHSFLGRRNFRINVDIQAHIVA